MASNGHSRNGNPSKKGQGVQPSSEPGQNSEGLFPDEMPTPDEVKELKAFGRRVQLGLERPALSLAIKI